jgi:hypothetical protein
MSEDETLEETYNRYMKGKIESREKKLELSLKSKVPALRAKLLKKYYDELVKAGFSKDEALAIIAAGVITL